MRSTKPGISNNWTALNGGGKISKTTKITTKLWPKLIVCRSTSCNGKKRKGILRLRTTMELRTKTPELSVTQPAMSCQTMSPTVREGINVSLSIFSRALQRKPSPATPMPVPNTSQKGPSILRRYRALVSDHVRNKAAGASFNVFLTSSSAIFISEELEKCCNKHTRRIKNQFFRSMFHRVLLQESGAARYALAV